MSGNIIINLKDKENNYKVKKIPSCKKHKKINYTTHENSIEVDEITVTHNVNKKKIIS